MEKTAFLITSGFSGYATDLIVCRIDICNFDSNLLFIIPAPVLATPKAGNLQRKFNLSRFCLKRIIWTINPLKFISKCSPDGENLFLKESHQMFFNNKINAMTAFLPT